MAYLVPYSRSRIFTSGGRLRTTQGGVRGPRSMLRRAPVRRRVVTHGYPRGAIRSELKSVDTTISSVMDTTGAVNLIDGIARGDDINERVGRQVVLKSVQFQGIDSVTSGTGIDQMHRYLIVFDRQSNGVAPAITDVLVSASPTALSNLDNRKRFVILVDSMSYLNASGESGSSRVARSVKRLNHTVQFNSGDAGTIADIQTGGLFLITVGNVAAGATAGVLAGRVRVRYTDQ